MPIDERLLLREGDVVSVVGRVRHSERAPQHEFSVDVGHETLWITRKSCELVLTALATDDRVFLRGREDVVGTVRAVYDGRAWVSWRNEDAIEPAGELWRISPSIGDEP